MSQESADNVFDMLAANMNSGGRIAYWELFNPRSPTRSSGQERCKLCEPESKSETLRRQDRTLWFSFHVLEMK